MAEDVRKFMEENWIYEANILGHSMGGKVGMHLALENPDIIEKLIVVDIAPRLYAPGHDQIFKALLNVPIHKLSSRSEIDESMADYIHNPAVRQFLSKNVMRNKTGGFDWKMDLFTIHDKYQEVLKAIEYDYPFEKPTLFIKGALSNYILDSDLPLIEEIFPNFQLRTINDAGHWVHSDKKDELVSSVLEFIL